MPTATFPPPTKTPEATEAPPTVTLVSPTAISTQTPPPTAALTYTPHSPIKLAVPDQWRERTAKALDLLNQELDAQEWLLLASTEGADVSLVQGEGHIYVEDQPLVLAVPFTTEWEETTLENAEVILTEGHDLVTIMPWNEITHDQKALRIDGLFPTDPGYPLQQRWSLVTTPGFKSAAAELQNALQASKPASDAHLVAVGDVMLDRSLGFGIQQADIGYPFEEVSEYLKNADVTIGNLESALGDIGDPAPKRYRFRAPPEAANSLAQAGFDILSLANNHALDFGADGLLQGIELLNMQGILTSGAGADAHAAHKPAIIEVGDLSLAFLSYVHVPVEALSGFDTEDWTATADSPGLAWADPVLIQKDVSEAKRQSDLVIVLLHSGHEYVEAPSEPQITAAYAAIDAGAALVIGHHSHILQGIEFYNDGVIIYGTGNFAFEIDGDPQTALFHLWVDEDGVRQIEIQPAIIQF
ncbi:MAG: CapA family protein, partial [Candidatus Promineifilaceae bacterium]|nr:CapA family protein [Candidatus Promineifilaceae bacterium]